MIIRADTAAVGLLADTKASTISELNPEIPSDLAEKVAESIQNLMSGTMENTNRNMIATTGHLSLIAANVNSDLSLRAPQHRHIDNAKEDWERIKEEVIKGISIVRVGGSKAVKAIIETGKRIVEFVIHTVTTAVKVLISLLKLIGLGLRALLNVVKFALNWDEVLNTQVALNAFVLHLRNKTDEIFLHNREKILTKIGFFKGNFMQKIQMVADSVKESAEYKPEIISSAVSKKTEYAFVTDMVASNNGKLSIVQPPKDSIGELERDLQEFHDNVPESEPKLKAEAGILRREVREKGIGAKVVASILNMIKFFLSVIEKILLISSAVVLVLLHTVVRIFWFIVTLEIKIPFISDFFKYVVSDGRYELSLMSLATLAPAMAYTYGYMVLHYGKAPFSGLSLDDSATVSIEKRSSTGLSRLSKRALTLRFGLGYFLTVMASLFIMIIMFNVMLAIFTVTLSLLFTMPFSVFLIMLLFFAMLG